MAGSYPWRLHFEAYKCVHEFDYVLRHMGKFLSTSFDGSYPKPRWSAATPTGRPLPPSPTGPAHLPVGQKISSFRRKVIEMPRITTLELPGCPPLRALTFDVLGLIKGVESRGERGFPTVVDRWGEPDSRRCVVAASIEDSPTNPHLAVARKNGLVEILNSMTGDVLASAEVSESGPSGIASEDDLVVSLHAFKPVESRVCKLFTCKMNGNANLQTVHVDNISSVSSSDSSKSWNVCSSGKVLCGVIDGSEKYAVFGGKGVEINVWDLHECSKIWTAKAPPRNNIGIFSPTWFTAATYLTNDHRKIVAGTNNHQVRLYDISAQRKPVLSFDFRESPIKAVTSDLDGYTIYVGSGIGDLASFDIRTGKLVGCFVGKCSGSIRCIARHPELPIIASCGLDSYLRFWDSQMRKPLSAIFLKQPLAHVILDHNFYVASDGAQEKMVGEVDSGVEEKNECSKRRLSSSKSEKAVRKRSKRKATVS